MTSLKRLTLSLVFLSPAAANAFLIEGLCDGTPDSAVTCDTDTGLEWLDLTATDGLSANQFLTDIGGWISAGWSMATGAQVDELLLHAGFTDLTGISMATAAPAGVLMATLFGSSQGVGFAIESATTTSLPLYSLAPSMTVAAAFGSNNCCSDYDTSSGGIGIWANRQGAVLVPEPGTLALLCLGVAGLGLTRRKGTF